ncbi:MAG: PKD repeat protein [Saprospiraceae bacterium]
MCRTSLYYANQCFDQIFSSSGEFTLCIPDEVVTFSCGTQLKILDTYFARGSSNAASNICNRTIGCACPKCAFFKGESVLVSPLLASFNYEITCPGADTIEEILFTNLTIGASSVYTHLWDFGDGSTSAEANPEHNYNSTGEYNVQLIVSDPIGLSDTIDRYITIDSYSTLFCQINGNLIICEGDNRVLTEDGGWAEEWSWVGTNEFIDSIAKFIIHPVSLSDSGRYKVVVANALGDLASCKVLVTVFEKYMDTISYNGCSGDGYTMMVGDSIFNEANPSGIIIMNTINGYDSTFVVNLQYKPQLVVDAGFLAYPASFNISIGSSDLGASISGHKHR